MYPHFIIEVAEGQCYSQRGIVNRVAGQETWWCAVWSVSGGSGLETIKMGEEGS